ncbi:MAG: TauD/TfdA family dioxygenase [Spirochaetaceae bacterium]|nr:TauD/TfdA family dioxygenase [Spirochaetaceae bacterium]
MEHSISRVVENGDAMAAVWRGGEETSLPYLWLRDNCGCSECRVVQTTEKRFHIFRVAREIRPRQVAIECPGRDDEALAIVWPDGHRTRYGSGELRRLAGQPHRTPDHVQHWDSSFQPRRYDFSRFLHDDRTAADLIEEFLATGACVLVDAPTEPDSSEQLTARLGPLREVVFDRIHNVVVDPKGYSIAHTDLAIAPHNDFTSYSWPPSVQVLHMLANECDGGESSIVDGFRVLDGLRREHPGLFDVLCTVPVPFRLASEHDESYAVNPMVELDGEGNVRLLRFNTQQMKTVPLAEHRLGAFYAAYHELSTRVNAAGSRVSLRLGAGQVLLIAAHRVLHGRTALGSAGRRHLQDAYFEHDNVRNHLALLRRTGRI